MIVASRVEEIVNAGILSPVRRICVSGNAATPQMLLRQVAADTEISKVEMFSVLLLGEIEALFPSPVADGSPTGSFSTGRPAGTQPTAAGPSTGSCTCRRFPAIGVDLHGNIWADSLQAHKIYSGVGAKEANEEA